jgi:hypothetical protein
MPLVIKKPLSDSEAVKAAKPLLWRGWFPAQFIEATETESKRGNAMIAVVLTVFNDTEEREFRDWYTASERNAARLRHACEAVGEVAKYEAGAIAAEDFPGHAVQVQLEVEKGRAGFPARSVIIDYKADSAADARRSVVNLRSSG